ncbi:MAG: hypothetical protein QOI83_4975 [Streptomycetaceae bacterium]|nr:hypothetical protein [Streptomycetaceae bacterium]
MGWSLAFRPSGSSSRPIKDAQSAAAFLPPAHPPGAQQRGERGAPLVEKTEFTQGGSAVSTRRGSLLAVVRTLRYARCGLRFDQTAGITRALGPSPARPGRSSEITAARHDKVTAHLREAGLGAIGDLGFVGLDDDPDDPIVTGRKAARNRPLTAAGKEANRLVSRERAANEHGFADLKAWRVLAKVRMDAKHGTALLRALLVLTRLQVTR